MKCGNLMLTVLVEIHNGEAMSGIVQKAAF